MGINTLHQNIVKLEARSSDDLEEMFEMVEKSFSVLSIYGMNGRHYAWLSLHEGRKKKKVKSRTTRTEPKIEKTKL